MSNANCHLKLKNETVLECDAARGEREGRIDADAEACSLGFECVPEESLEGPCVVGIPPGQAGCLLCGEEQDPYDLMSPGAPSYAFEPWLTIKFMSPVRVNGIRLQSCFECQPKSYTV